MMDYESVRKLDPLGLDERLRELPLINERADVDTLRNIANGIATDTVSSEFSAADALASLRDSDFILSSGIRHGENYIESVNGFERILMTLGRIANTVPRGTVTTYAHVNPSDERQRSFTGSDAEALFIDSVRTSSADAELAMRVFAENDIQTGLAAIDKSLDTLIESIIAVRRGVTATYFTNELRPYFDAVEIGGTSYAGAGGAQLQLIATDYVLWGVGSADKVYMDYYADNVRYLSPDQRAWIQQCTDRQNGRSVVDLLIEGNDSAGQDAAIAIFQKLKKFRFPHRRIAQDNFKLRGDDSVGSGTYTPDILDVLIDKTQENLRRLQDAKGEQHA